MSEPSTPLREVLSSILGKDEVRTSFETWSATLFKHAGLINPKNVGQFVGKHKAAFGAGGIGGAAMVVPEVADQVALGGRRLASWARRGLRISDAIDDMDQDNFQELRQGSSSNEQEDTLLNNGIHPQVPNASPLPYPSQPQQDYDVPQREKVITSPGGLALADDAVRNAFRGRGRMRRFR